MHVRLCLLLKEEVDIGDDAELLLGADEEPLLLLEVVIHELYLLTVVDRLENDERHLECLLFRQLVRAIRIGLAAIILVQK